ncbi:CDP-glycerol glycerophosphotransferase family protein [Rubrivivax sp. JA1026]|uniref:CDP-glycerol glycerophosphotransferase family protein n=1 Tax=Rubrivivax sp. JA1026 TaxID=2710888 RepID=UPI0013E8FC90|nr:CDP-glycerol glycerophosphotransferase family protein [Rubrivivax sp. JA1026]
MSDSDPFDAVFPGFPAAEPPAAFWRDPASYDAVLRDVLLPPLAAAARRGDVPLALQCAVLQRLHWYFSVDGRERAPTVVVDEAMAAVFHERVRTLMAHIEVDAVASFPGATTEIRHVLLAYRDPSLVCGAAVDAYDHRQGLARVSYWIHGEPPAERLLVDGREVSPAFAKRRACNYFRRRLLRQRIAWVDIAEARSLQLEVDGRLVALALGPQPFSARPAAPAEAGDGSGLPARIRAGFPPGKGGQEPLPAGWRGWKVRLLKALARSAPVRWRYGRSWVFIDREENADDSAEHLYRWVRQQHPEVNAWFMLSPQSADWPRLQAEGFRLMPPGWRRKLLVLNAEHIVSSHAEWVFGGFDRRLFGDAMQWRYTFLQHGVIKDDLSHWLGPREFDCFVSSSPAEHESIVGDDTAYPYTDREVRRTGLPRHDRLLRYADETPADEANILLVMPTWRGSLVDDRAQACTPQERVTAFAASEYATRWRAVLGSPRLHARAAEAGLKLAFMPHPNAVPYIEAFGLPPDVQLVTAGDTSIQRVFARAAAFMTDYTSVAFTMAFLRRPVFYYQFDQQSYYGGGHNWRPGYFDYERDGFGPVALNEDQLLVQLEAFFDDGCRVAPEFLARMERAMPDRDDESCARVYAAMLSLDQPRAAAAGQGSELAGHKR